jgi:hypothetical protein
LYVYTTLLHEPFLLNIRLSGAALPSRPHLEQQYPFIVIAFQGTMSIARKTIDTIEDTDMKMLHMRMVGSMCPRYTLPTSRETPLAVRHETITGVKLCYYIRNFLENHAICELIKQTYNVLEHWEQLSLHAKGKQHAWLILIMTNVRATVVLDGRFNTTKRLWFR